MDAAFGQDGDSEEEERRAGAARAEAAGGLHRRSTTCPCLRWQDSHVLEAVLSEEQVAAEHRSDCHWQQDNKKRDVETTQHPQHRNQRAVT